MNINYPAGGSGLLTSICLSFALWLGTILSASTHGSEAINLAWALDQTQRKNAELLQYPLMQEKLSALKLQAGIKPRLKTLLTVDNVLGSGNFSGVDSAEVTLALSQILELGNKLDSRVKFADAKWQQQQMEFELARLDVLAETSQRFYRALEIQAFLAVNSRRIEEERAAHKAIQQRARAGAVSQADVSMMELRLSRSLGEQQKLQQQHQEAIMQLATMWQSLPNFDEVIGDINQLPSLPSASVLTQIVDQTPALKSYLGLQRINHTRLALEQAKGTADWQWQAGIKRLQASSDQALSLSISMPLGASKANQGMLAAAQAELDLGKLRTELLQQQLKLSLLYLQKRMEHSLQQVAYLENTLLPKAQKLLTDTEKGYLNGRYGVLRWTDAQAELFALQRDLITEQIHNHLILLELERITGEPLTQAGNRG